MLEERLLRWECSGVPFAYPRSKCHSSVPALIRDKIQLRPSSSHPGILEAFSLRKYRLGFFFCCTGLSKRTADEWLQGQRCRQKSCQDCGRLLRKYEWWSVGPSREGCNRTLDDPEKALSQ